MPWIGSVLGWLGQWRLCWFKDYFIKKKGSILFFLCKGKLDSDNPVCHTNYSKQTWNLDCNLFTSQGGGLMLCGWRVKRGWGGWRANYLTSTLTDSSSLHPAKKSPRICFWQQKPKHPAHQMFSCLFTFEDDQKAFFSVGLWCDNVRTALRWTNRSVAGQGWQSSSTVPCFQTWQPTWTLPSVPLLSRTSTDRQQSLKNPQDILLFLCFFLNDIWRTYCHFKCCVSWLL